MAYGQDGNTDVLAFGRKEFTWVKSLRDPKLKVAAYYLMALREGCCDYLWRMEKNPTQEQYVRGFDLRLFNWGIHTIRDVFTHEKYPHNGIDEREAESHPSPRMLLSLCDSALDFLQQNT